MKNVTQRANANGTTSLLFRRQFKGHLHTLPFNQITGDTLEEKFDCIKRINNYLERVYELTKSRISMMDIIMSRKHISITGTPNKNARVVIYRKSHTMSWSIKKHGLQKALRVATESLLTMLGINDKANRTILGKVLKDRAINDYNELMYKHKKFGNAQVPELRENLSNLHKLFKRDPYGFQKANHVYCKSVEVQAYIMLNYSTVWYRVWDTKNERLVWQMKILKCLVIDSIDSKYQHRGNFSAFMNEAMKFAYRCKYDAIKIVNVVNDDFGASLLRNNLFMQQPERVDENGQAVYSQWQNDYVRVIGDFESAPLNKRNVEKGI